MARKPKRGGSFRTAMRKKVRVTTNRRSKKAGPRKKY